MVYADCIIESNQESKEIWLLCSKVSNVSDMSKYAIDNWVNMQCVSGP